MTHERLQKLVHSPKFIHTINYAIVINALIVGMETLVTAGPWQNFFQTIDYFFLGLFVLEIILRILAEDRPMQFFVLFQRVSKGSKKTIRFSEHGFWNYFDSALIILSVVGTFARFVHPTFVELGRLFRIFRIFRLLEISEHVKDVERRIVSIVPTVFSFVVLLLIMTYIYAVTGMYMFGQRVYDTCNFSNLIDSCVTLFQVMTLDNWSDVMKDIKTNAPVFSGMVVQLYFVSYVVFTSIIAFNVFIAVMTSQVQERLEREAREAAAAESASVDNVNETILSELKALRQEVAALRDRMT